MFAVEVRCNACMHGIVDDNLLDDVLKPTLDRAQAAVPTRTCCFVSSPRLRFGTTGLRRRAMSRHLTAIVEREGDGFVALCPQVDVASQGLTVDEARENLAEALALFFETAPASEIDQRLRGEIYVTQIEVAVG